MEYIRADISHIEDIARLALLLWSDDKYDDLLHDFMHALENECNAIFICIDHGVSIGFAEFTLRYDYVEGTCARPVGYVEAVYVMEQYRKRGIAKNLMGIGEQWAMEKGCGQIASDCELANTGSLSFHLHCGFAEANRVICFVKDIDKHT